MSAKHVTISGATGLVGSALVARLRERGDRVTVLSRSASSARQRLGDDVEVHEWDPSSDAPPVEALRGRDALVNLAGAPVFRRWTDAAKEELRRSRIATTEHLVSALAALPDPERPRTLVSGSASGIYGDRGEARLDEGSMVATGQGDFLADLAGDWEAAAEGARGLGVRVVALRTGLVLAATGGALAVMAKPFRLGLGGWLGNGRQLVPWIHLDDEVGLLLAALDHDELDGPLNASAPHPVTNKAFSKAVGRALRRPVLAPAPAPVLRLALGEQAQLVLDSCGMVPARAEALGYRFAHPEIDGALQDLLR
ncbi:TIGR01777 family oxidoreductase [Patulibacter brassicae]|uniref:TIGR01777 family oxidoreductase n=1 Tax=Patulibacter brassicae TaxID=1705717 RepID=A0ABU4VGU8_9ACTN|nr:TIGR01777 family oxidoreductase [Patulibacter brassicae]MDX8150602.1 TIGR01777 family oxidoreductase [Patulibacter brassicae]